MGTVDGFAELAQTPAASDALRRLRDATGGAEGPMERHCLRVRCVAAELARGRAWEVDGELLTDLSWGVPVITAVTSRA
jgi:hypothetical protein